MNATPHSFMNKLMSLLRVGRSAGGLEIGDSVLRYTYHDGVTWKMYSLRLPPDLVVGGVIKDTQQFVEALRALKVQIVGRAMHRAVNAVVTLSSTNIYSQVFSLPVIVGESFEKAIELNMQMISPDDPAQTYSGWQVVGGSAQSDRIEVLGAFMSRSIVDDMKRALNDAGFVVYALESRALSLARTIRTISAGFDQARSYIVINLDSNGLEFLVIRKGQLYFEYGNPWRDFETEGHEIAQMVFERLVVRNLHQVLNFYNSHWSEPVTEIFLSASALNNEVTAIINANFEHTIRKLGLTSAEPIEPDWFVVLGSGLRGLIPRRYDKDLSLLGSTAEDEFRSHQIVDFLGFWRVAVPAALTVLLAAFLGVDAFLMQTSTMVKDQVASTVVDERHSQEVAAIKSEVNEFNEFVSKINAIARPDRRVAVGVFDHVVKLFEAKHISIIKMQYRSETEPVSISARALSDDDVIGLKKTLDTDADIGSVNLPLTGIVHDDQGVTFSVSFLMALSKTP